MNCRAYQVGQNWVEIIIHILMMMFLWRLWLQMTQPVDICDKFMVEACINNIAF